MYWNPDPIAFFIPYFDFPIFTYGICFVLGFVIGYFILQKMLKKSFPQLPEEERQGLLDKLIWFAVGGTIIGARLGHVIFYDWDRYKNNLLQIFNTREGGLASHGGTAGVFLAFIIYYVWFYKPVTKKSFWELLDMVVVPTALIAFFIRIGNFFNQEIVGIPTDFFLAITFGAPAEGGAPVPRHPAQLYEAASYLSIFLILTYLWHKTALPKRPGFLTGLFFFLTFGSRFLIEFIKAEQHSILNQSLLQAGQWLSIPFIVGGALLMLYTPSTKVLKHE